MGKSVRGTYPCLWGRGNGIEIWESPCGTRIPIYGVETILRIEGGTRRSRRLEERVVLENNNGPLTQLSAEGLPLFRSSLQQDVHVSFQEIDPGEPGSADVQCVRRAAE